MKKGYFVEAGYMGYVDGRWMLFAFPSDYWEYLSDQVDDLAEYDESA